MVFDGLAWVWCAHWLRIFKLGSSEKRYLHVCINGIPSCHYVSFWTVHKHVLWERMQKERPLTFLTLVRGAMKKNTTNFPVKIEFTRFSMGLTGNFYDKKGGAEIFEVGRGATKTFLLFFLHQPPSYKCLWTGPYLLGCLVIVCSFLFVWIYKRHFLLLYLVCKYYKFHVVWYQK